MSSENIADLINQMNPKRDPDEIDIDINKKVSSEEKTFKSTVKDTEIDLYKILGVPSSATTLELKRAYQKKLKLNDPNRVQQTKENKYKYKLLREAGDILTDPAQRKAYDMQKKMDKSSKNFLARRDEYANFLKLQEQHMTDENKSLAKLRHESEKVEMNRKHGYNEKDAEAIPEEEYKRRIDDLKLLRDQEEIEIQPDDMFQGGQFNSAKFNAAFIAKKKRDEKRKNKNGIVKYNDNNISAFNDYDDAGNGASLDTCNTLYSDGKFSGYNTNFAGVGSGLIGANNGQSDDEISIDSPEEDYDCEAHNKNKSEDSFNAEYKKIMAERSGEDTKLNNLSGNDFGSVVDNKDTISSKFGFVVGTDKYGAQRNIKTRRINVKEATLKAYKELTEK